MSQVHTVDGRKYVHNVLPELVSVLLFGTTARHTFSDSEKDSNFETYMKQAQK